MDHVAAYVSTPESNNTSHLTKPGGENLRLRLREGSRGGRFDSTHRCVAHGLLRIMIRDYDLMVPFARGLVRDSSRWTGIWTCRTQNWPMRNLRRSGRHGIGWIFLFETRTLLWVAWVWARCRGIQVLECCLVYLLSRPSQLGSAVGSRAGSLTCLVC